MDIDPLNKAGRTSWIIAIATLVAIAIVQVYQIVAATDAALLIDLPHRKYMHRLAWLALAVLSVELVVLFWLAVRYISARGRCSEERVETPYVDAWAEAGQRINVDEPDDDEDDEDDDEDVDLLH